MGFIDNAYGYSLKRLTLVLAPFFVIKKYNIVIVLSPLSKLIRIFLHWFLGNGIFNSFVIVIVKK